MLRATVVDVPPRGLELRRKERQIGLLEAMIGEDGEEEQRVDAGVDRRDCAAHRVIVVPGASVQRRASALASLREASAPPTLVAARGSAVRSTLPKSSRPRRGCGYTRGLGRDMLGRP
jgi:hypothetical protein